MKHRLSRWIQQLRNYANLARSVDSHARLRRSRRLALEQLEQRQLLTLALAPSVLAHINTTSLTDDSTPTSLTAVGNTVFFTASIDGLGRELWKTDGTCAGTALVRNINSGSNDANAILLTNVSGVLFFSANDGVNGQELWKSDGTSQGTVLVKNIANGNASSSPTNLRNVSGTLFFAATDSSNGTELWKSDGTSSGTVLVKNLSTSGTSSLPQRLTNVNGVLYFSAILSLSTIGRELWKSDGTSSGTVLVKDIYEGGTANSSAPQYLTNVNGVLYFAATDGIHGEELWRSDGTSSGTVLVKDIVPGGDSTPGRPANVNGTLYFTVNNDELWKSDGTSTGTVLVSDVYPGGVASPRYLTEVNGGFYFSAVDLLNGRELWKSDGTSAGTQLVKNLSPTLNGNPNELINFGGTLYFRANATGGFDELWKTDGTSSGTVMVRDIYVGVAGSFPQYLVNRNGTLVFSAESVGIGRELWKSDGTSEGTVLIKDINVSQDSNVSQFENVNGKVYFTADDGVFGQELWSTDGTSTGTALVQNIGSGTNAATPEFLTNVNGILYFAATTFGAARDLWKSDGTNTTLIKNPLAGSFSNDPRYLVNVNGTVFFNGQDATFGRELWKSDGTNSGTVLVKDIANGSGSSSPNGLTNVNGVLYFWANDGLTGDELWRTDGTDSGTMLVKDIRPGSSGSTIQNLTNVNGMLFFSANDGVNGAELWRTNGTSTGTVLVKDIAVGTSGATLAELINVNGTLYFSATNLSAGVELWKSDGTSNGTILVKVIGFGTVGSVPQSFASINSVLYFAVTVSADGSGGELWKSNGTSSGTVLVRDIFPGAGSSDPRNLVNFEGTLYFRARHSTDGDELWRSDGTSSGTVLVKDIRSGYGGSNPQSLTNINGTLYFTANDGIIGRELWSIEYPDVSLRASVLSLNESGGTMTITAFLNMPSTENVTVNLSFSGVSTNNVDYSVSATQIILLAGQTSGSVTLTGLDDVTYEGDEKLIVEIGSVVGGARENDVQLLLATIVEDEPAPLVTLSVLGSPMNENGGVAKVAAHLEFTSTQDTIVALAFSGTAGNPQDYLVSSSSIVVPAGSTSGSITLTAVNNTTYEGEESILVEIVSVTNGAENGSQQVTVVVEDDESLPKVTISIGGAPMAENGSGTLLNIRLSPPSTQDVTVDIGFSGTATQGVDYSVGATSVVIPAGSTIGFIAVIPLNDLAFEGNETILMDVVGVTNGTENGSQQVSKLLVDDDIASSVYLLLVGSPLFENGGQASVIGRLSNSSSVETIIDLSFTGTALNLTDYSRSAAQIVIAAGNTSGSVTLTSLNDLTAEANETIVIDITGVTNGAENGTQQVTATILDDDPTPNVALALAGSPLNENGGSASVNAILSNPSSQDITVTLGFTGTATNLSDYSRSATQIVILAGNTSGSITLTALDDTTFEGAESIVVDVTSVANGTENGTQQVSATIADNDSAPTVTLSLVGNPFNENGGIASVIASLSNPSTQGGTVQLGFAGTALSNVDYSASSANIVIAAGSTSGSITLTGLNDITFEGNEAIIVDIVGVTGGAENGTQQVTATINEDDSAPSVSLAVTGSPFAENGGVASVRATLSNPSTQNVTINLGFSGTATSNSDYSRSGAQIVILAGNTSGAITLLGFDDLTDEADESVVVDIASVVNGTENGTQQVTAFVGDDDGVPSVNLNVSDSLSENNGIATVTATLSNLTAQDVTINLSFTGTAIGGVDYSTSATSILILAGQTSGTITLTGLNDNLDELNESIVIDVVDVTNGVESGTQQVTATINDDDPAPNVAITLAGSPLAENGGAAMLTATLSQPSSLNVTVQFGFSGNALGGVDYSASATNIVILAGQTSGSIMLTSLNDNVDEPNEAIVVDVIDVTNGVESGTQQVTATINDDDATPSVQWTLTGTTVSENVGSGTLVVTLSGLSSQLITVPFAVSGTATSISDYTLSASPITIPAGATSAAITLTVVDDVTSEGTETVVVTLNTPTYATLGAITSRTTQVTDNDAPPTVSFTASSFTLTENGGSITLVALLSAVLGQDVTINLGFSGSALSNSDYSASAASIVIAAGQTSGSISIASRDDVLAEGNETLVVDVLNVAGAVESGTQQAVITLVDDSNDPFAVTGSQLAIVGSPNNDSLVIQFTSTTSFSAQLGDTSMSFSLAQINTIDFDGQAGVDTLLFFGSAGVDAAALSTSSVNIGSSSYTVSASNLEYKYLFGDANDSATFNDTVGADQLYQLPAYSLMLDGGLSYYNQVIGFGSVTANTTTGTDILLVYGTGGNDTYSASTTKSTLTSTGLSLVGNNFDQVFAFGSGGNDTATFTGTSSDEIFYGLGGYGFSVVTSGVFLQYLIGFNQTTATAGTGNDNAIFFDAAGNDAFTGSPASASMAGPGFSDTATGFDSVFAIASGGGIDTTNLDGSNQDDLFSGNAFNAALFRSGVYLLQVYGFEQVNVLLTGIGTDVAELIDGFGNDVLNASGSTAEITYAAGNKIKLSAFDFVFAKDQNGGVNKKQVAGSLAYQLVFEGEWV